MLKLFPRLILLILIGQLVACTTALHGSFVENTYTGGRDIQNLEPLGPVSGSSCQTNFLYLIPTGEPSTTAAAMADAMSQREGTQFLADVAIDDFNMWKFGYSIECVKVEATAY